jgi:hypothetical protein
MSKTALKKELQGLTKEQLVEQILDLYGKNKAVKEFYDFYLNPKNEKELVGKYKKIIYKEFNLKNPMVAGLKFSVAKRAIADFKSLQPSPEGLADLMLYLPECACEFTANYGDMPGKFYEDTCKNFHKALEVIGKYGLFDDFELRAKQCVEWASPCGYGFAEDMEYIYDGFFSNKPCARLS